ncbi:hypothetical protein [Parvimonas micra]|uniref:hypothetical protein n=1 Tax=Parvimonas micra TaxID=33033 RepID=UPI00042A06F8|nr:hypothetical protein [Parvimonas micra]
MSKKIKLFNFKVLLATFSFCFLILFSSCKSSNVSIEKFRNKVFLANDNGRIVFHMDKINIKYPDYCWNKNSGVIVDKNGEVFKKPNREEAFFEAFNLKIEVRNGKKYINSDSKFYPNYRFEIKDEFTILDTLLGIEYVDNLSKYGIESDDNEYINAYKEAKDLVNQYKNTVKGMENNKDELSPKVKDEIEREMKKDKK